jgi:hypothetical protein
MVDGTKATKSVPDKAQTATRLNTWRGFVTQYGADSRRLLYRNLWIGTLVPYAAAAALAAAGLIAAMPSWSDPLVTYPLKIKGHPVRAELANTDQARMTGLMFRESLPENSGMLFVYEHDGVYAMWMKNTYVPLSVAFIDRHGVILNIEDMEPQTLDSHGSAGAARYSLEMNQGWFKKRGIKKGDKVLGLEKLAGPQ